MMAINTDIQNDASGTNRISMWAFVVRGLLLIIFAYVGYIWISLFALKGQETLRLDAYFFQIILPCIFYFVIGGIGGYLFWPRGYWPAAVWLAFYYPVWTGFHLFWRWSYLLIICAVLAGYALQRLLLQKYENQRNLRSAIVTCVVVASVVFAAERIVANTRFYTSEAYRKATTIDLPSYKNASGIRLKRDYYQGRSFLTFTSETGSTREIFNFYDRALTEHGYIRRGEPAFDDSNHITVLNMDGKAKPSKTKLFAQWSDPSSEVSVAILGSVESDPERTDGHESSLKIMISAACLQDRLYWGMLPL